VARDLTADGERAGPCAPWGTRTPDPSPNDPPMPADEERTRKPLEIRIERFFFPRFKRWHRYAAVVLLAGVLLSATYSFFVFPRLRYLFTAVPVIPSAHDTAAVVAGLSPEVLSGAEAIVSGEVNRGGFPGGALAIGEGGRTLAEVGIGRTEWGRLSDPVDADGTVYDLASLTKVMGTTTAVMILVDDGRLRLDDRVARWVPEFHGEGRDSVTVRQLLTHTSGLPAGMAEVPGATPEQRLAHLLSDVRLIDRPGASVLYSDVGFIVLGEVVARAAGEPLPAFLRRRVWTPLRMTGTRFRPGQGCDACAPTLTLEDGTPFAGETNDPLSRELGGITGNAGLFSTVHDVGRYAALIAGGGALDGVRIVQDSTLRLFTRAQPGTGTRGLGFEVFCEEGTVPDRDGCKLPYAFGHTGYTGTSLWIDPRSRRWVVLLTNRTYLPRASNRIQAVRRQLFNLVVGYTADQVREDTTDVGR